MPWEPLAEWGPLDSDFDELSPPSTASPLLLLISYLALSYSDKLLQ